MKAINLTIAMLLFIAFSKVSVGQITSSAHDFSGETWNTSGEICIVCHTPHLADISVLDAPIWNHAVTGQTFQVYSSSTFDGTAGQPDGSSKLCLSCHDGVTAVNNFGGSGATDQLITGNANLTTDLRDDHPVSFVYDAALAVADGELKDPSENSGMGSTIAADMLIGGKLQCASCHDVHNSSGINYLLKKSNAASALCLTCHVK